MTEPEFIDPSEVRPGPIRHNSLSPELLERIEAVFQVVGPYLDTTRWSNSKSASCVT
jgi:hypothetical protein